MFTLSGLATLFQILLIDISLAGDNAIAVGLAAAGLPAEKRRQAVVAGIVAATTLRILFAVFAVNLLHLTGLLAAGGLVLCWVAWKMVRDIRHMQKMKQPDAVKAVDEDQAVQKTLLNAIVQIVIADVSMSIDNVLAVAGVARDHFDVLATGLALSVLLMAMASAFVARLTTRYPWIAYLGLAVVLYTAIRMMWDGAQQIITTYEY